MTIPINISKNLREIFFKKYKGRHEFECNTARKEGTKIAKLPRKL